MQFPYPLKTIAFVLLGVTLVFTFNGCEKSGCSREYNFTGNFPIYMSYEDMRNGVFTDAPQPLDSSLVFAYSAPYLFLNEFDKGIHVYDITNPAAPFNIGFVHIPGNTQLTVSGSRLYANSFVDLVVLDISDIHNIHESGRLTDVFAYRDFGNYFVDPAKGVIVGWEMRDTVIVEECGYHGSFWINPPYYDDFYITAPIAAGGQTGYLNHYTMNSTGDELMCMDEGELQLYNVSVPDAPTQFASGYQVGSYTLTESNGYYFVGSHILTAENGTLPVFGYFHDAINCDRIVVQDSLAFAIKRQFDFCSAGYTQLDVYDLSFLIDPYVIATLPMENPTDIDILNEWIYIIDDSSSLSMYHFDTPDVITTFDSVAVEHAGSVRAFGDKVIVRTTTGYQIYRTDDVAGLTLLSEISE